MPYSYIVCHYGEIGIKGDNRDFFEQKLKDNIKTALRLAAPEAIESVMVIPGRIIVRLTPVYAEREKEIRESLRKVFGIVNFSYAYDTDLDLEKMQAICFSIYEKNQGKTFRVTTIRAQKNFHLNSQQINERLGGAIFEKYEAKVNLSAPELNIFIEIINKRVLIYAEKIKGVGGLPVGASGRGLAFLSGGIDSPVGAYYALKRGVPLVYAHFHSMPFTSRESVEKVKQLAGVLKQYGGQTKIYLIPFAEAQKNVLANSPAKLRIILYRRLMMRIGEKIAVKEKCLGIVTGESIGQVASQTMENMRVIEETVKLPIIRPVVGFDKEEIIAKAREIGTYDLSILPHDDCCIRFIPSHPETRAKLDEVKAAEKDLNVRQIVSEAIKNAKIEYV